MPLDEMSANNNVYRESIMPTPHKKLSFSGGLTLPFDAEGLKEDPENLNNLVEGDIVPSSIPVSTSVGMSDKNESNNFSMKVALRIRPCFSNLDKDKVAENCVVVSEDGLSIGVTAPKKSNSYKHGDMAGTFTFSKIFPPKSSQEDVYDHMVNPLVNGLFDGFNGCVFAYGMTNSGKTHTIMGPRNDPGIVPRALKHIFERLKRLNSEGVDGKENNIKEGDENPNTKNTKKDEEKLVKSDKSVCPLWSVRVSFLEIYNEGVYDLLETNSDSINQKRQRLKIKEDIRGRIFVDGAKVIPINSSAHGMKELFLGTRRRKVAFTQLNADSSRSHSIFTMQLYNEEKAFIHSELSVVDLAGSERGSRTGTIGVRLKEASTINNSLMCLMRCIKALHHNQKLKANIGRLAGRTAMIVNINSSAADYDETLHVLKYSALAKSVVVSKSRINTGRNNGKYGYNGRRITNKKEKENTKIMKGVKRGLDGGIKTKQKRKRVVNSTTCSNIDTISQSEDETQAFADEVVTSEMEVVVEEEGFVSEQDINDSETDDYIEKLLDENQKLRSVIRKVATSRSSIESEIRAEVSEELADQLESMESMWRKRLQEATQLNNQKWNKLMTVTKSRQDTTVASANAKIGECEAEMARMRTKLVKMGLPIDASTPDSKVDTNRPNSAELVPSIRVVTTTTTMESESDNDEDKETFESMRIRAETADKKVNEVMNELSNLKELHDNINKQYIECENKVTILENDKNAKDAARNEAVKLAQNAVVALELSKKKALEWTKERESITSQIRSLEESRSKTETEKADLIIEIEMLKTEKIENQKIISELHAAENNSLRETINTTEAQIMDLQKKEKEMQSLIEKEKAHIVTLEAKVDSLTKKKVDDNNNSQSELDELRRDCRHANETVETLRSETAKLVNEKNKLENRIESMNADNSIIKSMLESCQAEKEQLVEEIDDIAKNSINNSVDAENAKIIELEKQLDMTRRRLEDVMSLRQFNDEFNDESSSNIVSSPAVNVTANSDSPMNSTVATTPIGNSTKGKRRHKKSKKSFTVKALMNSVKKKFKSGKKNKASEVTAALQAEFSASQNSEEIVASADVVTNENVPTSNSSTVRPIHRRALSGSKRRVSECSGAENDGNNSRSPPKRRRSGGSDSRGFRRSSRSSGVASNLSASEQFLEIEKQAKLAAKRQKEEKKNVDDKVADVDFAMAPPGGLAAAMVMASKSSSGVQNNSNKTGIAKKFARNMGRKSGKRRTLPRAPKSNPTNISLPKQTKEPVRGRYQLRTRSGAVCETSLHTSFLHGRSVSRVTNNSANV